MYQLSQLHTLSVVQLKGMIPQKFSFVVEANGYGVRVAVSIKVKVVVARRRSVAVKAVIVVAIVLRVIGFPQHDVLIIIRDQLVHHHAVVKANLFTVFLLLGDPALDPFLTAFAHVSEEVLQISVLVVAYLLGAVGLQRSHKNAP